MCVRTVCLTASPIIALLSSLYAFFMYTLYIFSLFLHVINKPLMWLFIYSTYTHTHTHKTISLFFTSLITFVFLPSFFSLQITKYKHGRVQHSYAPPPFPGNLGCEHLPGFHLSLLTTRGRAQSIVVPVSLNTFAPLINLTLLPFIQPKFVVCLLTFLLLSTSWLVHFPIPYLSRRPTCLMTFPLIPFISPIIIYIHDSTL